MVSIALLIVFGAAWSELSFTAALGITAGVYCLMPYQRAQL